MTTHHGGLIISALATKIASGSGKTTITAALLAALRHHHQLSPHPYKIGPDYLDGKIHGRVAGRPCFNLDGFAMGQNKIITLLNQSPVGVPRIIEGVMGFFDGARAPSPHGSGNTAELAQQFGFALLLVVRGDEPAADIARMIQPIEKKHRLVAVVINDVGKGFDKKNWHAAWQACGVVAPIIFLPRQDFTLPHRHLGLHQAEEWHEADWHMVEKKLLQMAQDIKIAAGDVLWQELLSASMVQKVFEENFPPTTTPAPSKNYHLAVARDAAFSFIYPHHLFFWRQRGVDISFFSPLKDETPPNNATAIFLPGGYPELHLPQLSAAKNFFSAMTDRNNIVYGECGGFMMLGREIIDRHGAAFPALGLLPHSTSFANPSLHLGYRFISPHHENLSPAQRTFFHFLFDDGCYGHEFHYCANLGDHVAAPLFTAQDSRRHDSKQHGEIVGSCMGSFLHLI